MENNQEETREERMDRLINEAKQIKEKFFDDVEGLIEFFDRKGLDEKEIGSKYCSEDIASVILDLETTKHEVMQGIAQRLGVVEMKMIIHATHVAMYYGFYFGLKHGIERQEFESLGLPDIEL